MKFTIMAAALSLTLTAPVSAETAHSHSVAHLNIALEDQHLVLELISPADNVLGFEHAPADDNQRQVVRDAKTLLENADQLFALTETAGCTLQQVRLESELLTEHHDEEHHSESHDEEHHDEETHSDFHGEYHYQCDQPELINTLTLKMFEALPRLEEVQVQYIGSGGQTQVELTPDSPQFTLP